ncbi:Ribosomal-protein-alanine acetyltransferase [Paragonimus heterotremus]|uniref:Ribosomal-protein-alanine acetyltransferase n=1 Tax=Paragonimus heterotremus TaxID=100268 RepID=A0A8J4WM53_9TREM|nr:Ribosomal-protein-alanine acetyltransferase [Paragonimus heterotremus]
MSALIILSEGAEEIETVTVADVLARAGIKVTLGGLQSGGVIKCSRGIGIQADIALSDTRSKLYDVIVMPGGLGGSKAMAASPLVKELLEQHYKADKYVASICAAPIGLQAHGIGLGKTITSYPSFKDQLKGFKYSEETVVVDGKLVTSRGPGTAMLFALKLVELLVDKKKALEVAKGMLVDYK